MLDLKDKRFAHLVDGFTLVDEKGKPVEFTKDAKGRYQLTEAQYRHLIGRLKILSEIEGFRKKYVRMDERPKKRV